MNKLKALKRYGKAVQIKIVAHNQTWIEDYDAIEKLEWTPRRGRPSPSSGEQVDWKMQLKQYVVY